MQHLSSCYFCGTALDAPLEEYPVVPELFRNGDTPETTATLCPTCYEKLETVLDAVVDAATDGEPTPADSATETTEKTETPDETPASDDSETTTDDITADDVAAMAGDLDSRILDDDTDDVASDDPTAADTTTDDDITAEDVAAMAGDIDEGILDDTDEEDDDSDDLREAMSADVPAELDAGGDDETAAETADTDTSDPLADDGDANETVDNTDETVDDTDADSTAAEVTSDSETETGDDDAPTAARTSISALEYNKVMRLLQNRQFPVARAEIETVAANAYDLSQQECAEVIDLAVDRGLIGESGDQLVRPE